MSGHGDTIRRERETRHSGPERWRERWGEHWPLKLREVTQNADAAVDALLAENQRLREALELICEIGETRDVTVAREALAGDGE